jgi:hypothetical protein
VSIGFGLGPGRIRLQVMLEISMRAALRTEMVTPAGEAAWIAGEFAALSGFES